MPTTDVPRSTASSCSLERLGGSSSSTPSQTVLSGCRRWRQPRRQSLPAALARHPQTRLPSRSCFARRGQSRAPAAPPGSGRRRSSACGRQRRAGRAAARSMCLGGPSRCRLDPQLHGPSSTIVAAVAARAHGSGWPRRQPLHADRSRRRPKVRCGLGSRSRCRHRTKYRRDS